MNRYLITLENGYGRELHREEVSAASLRLALLVSEQVLLGQAEREGEAVSASVELVGSYAEVPEGSTPCLCGAVTHWQGEPAETCLRCGRSLVEQSASRYAPYRCQPDESAGMAEEAAAGREIGSCGPRDAFSELRPITTMPDVARMERLAAALREEAAAFDPREADEYGRGLGEIDGGEEL